MLVRKAERKKAKIRAAIQGPSGSGKTYSSILLAQGLADDPSTICIIDTEFGSSDLYTDLGEYSVINLKPPFTPESYMEAITLAEESGFEVIIIDSMSHCWQYLVEFHASLSGNSFTNWAKIKPRVQALTNKILSSSSHIISTFRTKQDYILNKKSDVKLVPEKVGMKTISHEGADYDYTLVFDIDIKHFANSSKDRTGLFKDQKDFIITPSTGKKIKEWCNIGINKASILIQIKEVKTLKELSSLYYKDPSIGATLSEEFSKRKKALELQLGKEELMNGIKTEQL